MRIIRTRKTFVETDLSALPVTTNWPLIVSTFSTPCFAQCLCRLLAVFDAVHTQKGTRANHRVFGTLDVRRRGRRRGRADLLQFLEGPNPLLGRKFPDEFKFTQPNSLIGGKIQDSIDSWTFGLGLALQILNAVACRVCSATPVSLDVDVVERIQKPAHDRGTLMRVSDAVFFERREPHPSATF